MAYRKENSITEGTFWALAAFLSGGIANVSPHPVIKFGALLIAIASGTNAVNCYKNSAKTTYQQLTTREEHYLPPD